MFIFRFEKLLKLKKDMLQKCMLEIANINALITKNREVKHILEQENRKRKKELNKTLKEKPAKNRLLFMYENIQKTDSRIEILTSNILSLMQKKKEKIEEAKILNIEKKKLEKLKEKEYENHIKKENNLETRFLDEIANIKAANRLINS